MGNTLFVDKNGTRYVDKAYTEAWGERRNSSNKIQIVENDLNEIPEMLTPKSPQKSMSAASSPNPSKNSNLKEGGQKMSEAQANTQAPDADSPKDSEAISGF